MAGRRIINDTELEQDYRAGKSLKEMGKAQGVSSVAIHKRIKRLGLSRLPKSMENLTEKERAFCLSVASGQTKTNAVMSAYDVVNRNSAKALQYSLMKLPEIRASINDLMEARGIGKVFRVEKLAEHMQSRDEMIALKALDMGMKIADDSGERTKGTPEGWMSEKFDITLVRSPDSFPRLPDQCTICKMEGAEPFCDECLAKYPVLTDKISRHWEGDVCACCNDDRRCLEYCLSCKKKEEVSHIHNQVILSTDFS
jgi:hypothetical protein